MNYKKNILSLVTIIALSGTAMADTGARYVRLTSNVNDASWTLFGVNGFSNGIASSRFAITGNFDGSFTAVQDTEVDDVLSVCGLKSTTGVVSGNLLCVQAIDDKELSDVQVAAAITQPYEPTEPVRTMYIKVDRSYPSIKVDYKASMEGQELQVMINEDNVIYTVTLDEDKTYSNPAQAAHHRAAGSDCDRSSRYKTEPGPPVKSERVTVVARLRQC